MKKIMILILITIQLITGCTSNEDRVVIYTSMEEERNQALKEQIKEKFTNIDIVVQYMATGNSAAKIKNEGSKIEADIIIDLETSHMESLKENFTDISSFNTDVYLDNINTSTNYLIWSKQRASIIIDKEYFNEQNLDIPKTYNDLLKKEYKDLIAMPDPKTSGTGYSFYLNVVNIMGEESALKYFKELKNNSREFTTSGSGPTNLLKQGEVAIALGMTSQGADAISEGYNFQIIELESGSPYSTTSCGIIKGKELKSNVKEVFNWLITDFIKYDKEKFMPDIILKNQENKMNNYPINLKDADMTGIESAELKTKLTEKWSEVNG